MSVRDVAGRMVDHPCNATGPFISFPVSGFLPIKLHAGSWIRIMSNSVVLLLRSWMVACFFLCIFICAILIGRVTIGGRPFIGERGLCSRSALWCVEEGIASPVVGPVGDQICFGKEGLTLASFVVRGF